MRRRSNDTPAAYPDAAQYPNPGAVTLLTWLIA